MCIKRLQTQFCVQNFVRSTPHYFGVSLLTATPVTRIVVKVKARAIQSTRGPFSPDIRVGAATWWRSPCYYVVEKVFGVSCDNGRGAINYFPTHKTRFTLQGKKLLVELMVANARRKYFWNRDIMVCWRDVTIWLKLNHVCTKWDLKPAKALSYLHLALINSK